MGATTARIERVYLPQETLGSFYVNGIVQAKTLELLIGDRKDVYNVNCIQETVGSVKPYLVKKEPKSPKFDYWHFGVYNVPGRQGIKIHKGNFHHDSLGCIMVGTSFADIDKDHVLDIIQPTIALEHLLDIMADQFLLTITEKQK